MAIPLRYADLIVAMKDPYNLRLEMIRSVQEIGIKPTARRFATSALTVRKWWRRHQQAHRSGLLNQSRAPKTCPHRMPPALEAQVIRLRKQTGFGARRLKEEFELPCAASAIARVFRQHQLQHPKKKKHKTKQDLRQRKAQWWAITERICHDTKDLDDIPHYWPQMQALRLPTILYTAREVRTGLAFIDFAQQRSATLACVFAQRLCHHLQACGVPLAHVTFQTDNGSEYIGGRSARGDGHGFGPAVAPFGVAHRFIPPGAHSFQSDVETFHRLIEDEFFDRESFASRSRFLHKATTYLLYFNLVRKNSYKGFRSPLAILKSEARSIAPHIALWQPAFLEDLLPSFVNAKPPAGGNHLPAHP